MSSDCDVMQKSSSILSCFQRGLEQARATFEAPVEVTSHVRWPARHLDKYPVFLQYNSGII